MKAVQAQRIHVMNVQSMHDWMSLKVGQTGKREVRAEHLNMGKSLPNLADRFHIHLPTEREDVQEMHRCGLCGPDMELSRMI
jgi:hypothetical protein